LLQTQAANPAVVKGHVAPYAGAWNCLSRVTTEQGFMALWRGNMANCLRYAPQQGSALAFNDAIRRALPSYNPKHEYSAWLLTSLAYGGIAGALSCTLCYPLDYAHTCLAAEMGGHGRPRFAGIMDCVTTTVRSQGILGLYTGWLPTVLGAFVFYGAMFASLERVLRLNPYPVHRTAGGSAQPKQAGDATAYSYSTAVVCTLACACVARAVPLAVTYPVDTLRRRMMLWSDVPKKDRMYPSLCTAYTRMMRDGGGIRGLYSAAHLDVMRSCGVLTVLALCDAAVDWNRWLPGLSGAA
jgi:solute carrier family 25 (adenine nucleotide translocator) protein 4/5/6/31